MPLLLRRRLLPATLLAGMLVALTACDSGSEPAGAAAEGPGPPAVEPGLPQVLGTELAVARYDLDGLIEAGFLRVLVGNSRTHYFMDGLTIRGITAETLKEFEPFLKKALPGHRIGILPVPVARNEMIDFLAQGLGDLALGNITITAERARLVDFSVPIQRDVAELIVHGVDVPAIGQVDDLAGRTIHLRRSSSFFETVAALNASLESRGLQPVEVVAVDEHLQTEDILELVNAGDRKSVV